MFGYKRIVIGEHERGIEMRNKRFQAVLGPGVYNLIDPLGRSQVQVYDLSQVVFEHPQLDTLLQGRGAELREHLQVVEIGSRQVGLVYQDGRLSALLAPETRTVYWGGPVEVRVEVQDIAEDFRLPRRLAIQLAHGQAATAIGPTAWERSCSRWSRSVTWACCWWTESSPRPWVRDCTPSGVTTAI